MHHLALLLLFEDALPHDLLVVGLRDEVRLDRVFPDLYANVVV